MKVDLKPETGGRWHFTLGPVEKWIVGAVAAAALAMAWWLFASVQTLLTQQALTNQKLQDISVQLSGVPELGTRVARLEVRVEQSEKEIAELRRLEGVK